jgi:SprT-like family
MPSTAANNLPRIHNSRARAAHVAIAAQVELEGTNSARVLYEAARKINDQFFDGKILPIIVEITPPSSMRALADYRPRTHEGLESHIRIGQKVIERGPRFALDVLLHEIVHAYCQEVIQDGEPGYSGHGPKWTAQCNRIGRELGLPEVFTKGRGGPNSARWPLCVRPAGYYGEEPEAKPKKERAPARESAPRQPAAEAKPIEQIADLLPRLSRAELEALRDVVLGMLGEE